MDDCQVYGRTSTFDPELFIIYTGLTFGSLRTFLIYFFVGYSAILFPITQAISQDSSQIKANKISEMNLRSSEHLFHVENQNHTLYLHEKLVVSEIAYNFY